MTGTAMALAAAALWGTTGTAQSLGGLQASPYWVGALRLLVASAFFAAVVVLGCQWGGLRRLPWRTAWPWVLGGGLTMAAYNLCFFAGVQATGVATGTGVALGSGPVWAGVLQWLMSRQAPRPIWWVGTGLAVLGIVLMLAGAEESTHFNATGVVLCLAAGLAYAAYTVVSSHLLGLATPAVVTLVVFAAASALATPLAAAISPALSATASAWVVVAYLGVVATGVAYLLFSHALRLVSVATGVTLSLAEPVTAFVLAVLLVGEQPGAGAYLGLGCVVAGLLAVVWGETRRR